jgi:hypothetical protein
VDRFSNSAEGHPLPSLTCPRCHTDAMVPGRILVSEPHPAGFRPSEAVSPSFWVLSLAQPAVSVNLEGPAAACANCGFLAVSVNPERLREVVRRFGTPELQARLREALPPEAIPIQRPDGRGDEGSSTL